MAYVEALPAKPLAASNRNVVSSTARITARSGGLADARIGTGASRGESLSALPGGDELDLGAADRNGSVPGNLDGCIPVGHVPRNGKAIQGLSRRPCLTLSDKHENLSGNSVLDERARAEVSDIEGAFRGAG
ncbi:MAG: hypothetical protein JWQ50_6314 [Caballeronia mineralivorans]|jgi:hypothetical protein|nr:hypothetical protein [Caballeronia mineralivorans]